MERIHNYKKVAFDADKFYNTAKEQGISLSELGQKVGMSYNYFYTAKREGKINPAVLKETK